MSGSVWVATYVVLWVAVLVLAVVVVALLRQVGVLHARLRPLGVHFGGEGLETGSPAPPIAGPRYGDAALTLIAFTSPTCDICERLVPSLRALDREYPDVALAIVDHGPDTVETFLAFRVSSTPFVIAVDRWGVVRGGGVANSLEQVEVLVQESLAARAPAGDG